MARATQNSEAFGRLYSWLLLLNLAELVLLALLIGANAMRLWRQYRARVMGSRLTLRLVALFVILAVVPVSLVYSFSLDFIRRGVDSWFDVRLEQALDNALELSRSMLEQRERELLRRTRALGRELAGLPAPEAARRLDGLRRAADAGELTLLTAKRGFIASSSEAPAQRLLPRLPDEGVMFQLRQGVAYVGLDRLPGLGLNVRVVMPLAGAGAEPRILQALYPVPERLGVLIDQVQHTYARYEQLRFLREPLKFSFALTLSLVLLLSLLTAVWAAFYSARRLVAPIRSLAIGTRAVAAGDYRRQLPQPGHDELGILVRSFNEMTRRIAAAREQARRSQEQLERQRAYLEAVLARLSSGVLALDGRGRVRTANAAAAHLLGLELEQLHGRDLEALGRDHPHLARFAAWLAARLAAARGREWREEVGLPGPAGRRVLICGGAPLPPLGEDGAGHVVVFEDITALIQAQRDAAWAEMARRLAHEIKNPLTPIQLSAERLRRRYLPRLDPEEGRLLDRATHTIVQQVEVMKELVKAFSDYARTPRLDRRPRDLNTLVEEVVELYRGHREARLELRLDRKLPPAAVDPGRFRQLLHNLIKNALEAAAAAGRPGRVVLATRRVQVGGEPFVELSVEDDGPGFPEAVLEAACEPYVTTKARGSGLGLAIVKKIVEEHGGELSLRNLARGACVQVRLPAAPGAAAGPGGPPEGEGEGEGEGRRQALGRHR
ncbi:MAG: HAMP domain-containing protein [Gammaproteobacteria bacterium]|nr:MAG: HAMP domain-containing protein [Gammaproteobacteria bacterium]